jgi:hypothetical protein
MRLPSFALPALLLPSKQITNHFVIEKSTSSHVRPKTSDGDNSDHPQLLIFKQKNMSNLGINWRVVTPVI